MTQGQEKHRLADDSWSGPVPNHDPYLLRGRASACALFGALLALAPGAAGCSRAGLNEPSLLHPCLALEPGLSQREVAATVQFVQSDVLFLVDNSSSMSDEIGRIREELRDVLVPQIRARLPDTDFGLATFSDFGEVELGERSHPYLLLQPISDDIEAVRAATKQIELEYGGDDPESQLEALYQAATGDGYGIYIHAKKDCPFGTHAGVCFRDGAFAIVLLFTDAPMRNVTGITSDGTLEPDDPFNPAATGAPYIPYVRTYDETLRALQKENMHVVGLWSGTDEGLDDMRRVVRDTGSVDAQGEPIVFDIGAEGGGLDEGVVKSIETLASSLRLGVHLELSDADPDDDFDPRKLVRSIQATHADPAAGAEAAGDRFEHVATGTRVFFNLEFDSSTLPSSAVDRRFPLGLKIEADDGTVVYQETVDVLVAAKLQCSSTSTQIPNP